MNLIHLEKGTPWIGGDPQEANPIRFGEGDSLEANPIRCGEGEPLEVNLIHLEKRTPWIGGGTSMRRIPFALEKGTPMKRIHSLRRGGSP